MNNQKFNQSQFFARRLLFLLIALLLTASLFSIQGSNVAFADIYTPPDDDDDLIGGNPPAFRPPENGFRWSVPARYGLNKTDDGLMDTYWRASTFDYDPAYIYPETWSMNFFGCQTGPDAEVGGSETNTYEWIIDGVTIADGGRCTLRYDGFTQQGNYQVTLRYTPENGEEVSFTQQVYIRDYLLIAIGDSLASGEGNPDIRQPLGYDGIIGYFPTDFPVWQDKRCHRSAYAYPSLAAIQLELSDPHTSVTFISFACSGATIFNPIYDLSMDAPFIHPRGTGVLGAYIGTEWEGDRPTVFIPSQIDQVKDALTPPAGKVPRRFDALIISAGGNDFRFGDIAASCLVEDNCWNDGEIFETPFDAEPKPMQQFIQRALTPQANGGAPYSLPDAFAALNDHIAGNNQIDALNPLPEHVYITQYADQTRANTYGTSDANFCRMLDDILWPANYAATPFEARMLATVGLTGLNNAIRVAAQSYGWQYVDGITTYYNPVTGESTPGEFLEGPDGRGHGYCASDNWIVRADESEMIQGPWPFQRFATKGTMHPNLKGTQVLRDRLLNYLRPDLEATLPGDAVPPSDPPTFSTSFTSGELTSQPGANGWYTHSCNSNGDCLPQVVLQVTATGSVPLTAANFQLNDQAGCSMPGLTCARTEDSANNRVRWDFSFTTDGTYRMQFSVKDSNDQIATHNTEIKVDLHGPVFNPLPSSYDVNEGSSIILTAAASDTISSILNYDWDLDNDLNVDDTFETLDEQPTFSAAGLEGPSSLPIRVRVTDEAGHSTMAEATINVLNVAPVLSNLSVPSGGVEEGASFTLSGDITDPGTKDAFVLKIDWGDGSTEEVASLPAGSTGFNLSHAYADDDPTDTASDTYQIGLSITDDDNGTDTGSVSVLVKNLAPSLVISTPENGSLNAVNADVHLSALLTDPSSLDTLTCSVNWGDGTTEDGILDKGVCTASHAYQSAGVYTIMMTAEDDDTGVATASVMVVVYDPSAGFVTGGGWIESPAGAYTDDPNLAGIATFGFVSKYQKNASVPTGNTAFEFEVGSLEFHSTAYEWLVVNGGGTNAQFKGSGLINGAQASNGEDYKFMLCAGDGSPDTFRIRIWWEDASGVEQDVYDNGTDQTIGGGSIVVHTKK